jgi:Spy/CpxP family protein refolding chaperone
MSRRVLMLVGLAVVGSWSVPVYAQSPQAIAEMMMMGDGPVLVIPVLLEFGDLTADQTDQVRQVVEAKRPNVQRLLSQVAEANNQLADALLAPAAVHAHDAGAILQRLAQLRLQFMQSELTTVLAIRKILTPEQFSKVTAAMDEMKKAGTGQLAPGVGTF